MAWLGPRRFGLYSLRTVTELIILYMAGKSTMVVLTYYVSSFYANKEQSMLSVQCAPLRRIHQWNLVVLMDKVLDVQEMADQRFARLRYMCFLSRE